MLTNRGHKAAPRAGPRESASGAASKHWFWAAVGAAILVSSTACAAPATRGTVAPPVPAAATATASPTPAPANATAVPPTPTAAKAAATPPLPLTADDVPRISAEELKALVDEGANVLIVDARPAEAYTASHIVGALSLPSAELEVRLQELPRTKDIVTYCT